VNRLVLEISQKQSADDKKTAAFPRRRPPQLGRRRLQPAIRFFDLSMVTTGPGVLDFTKLNYEYPIETFASDYDPPEDNFTNKYDIPSGTEYNGLITKITEQPVNGWASYYKKLTPAMDLGITVDKYDLSSGVIASQELSDDNPNFTDNGLTLPSHYFDSPYKIYFDGFFNYTSFYQPFIIGEHSSNKITATANISASAVSFTPSNRMDVFLMPSLCFQGSWIQLRPAASAPRDLHLNEFWDFYPREAMLNPAHPIHDLFFFNVDGSILPRGGLLHDVPALPAAPYDPTLYARGLALAEWMTEHPNARSQVRNTINTGAFSSADPVDFLNGLADTPDSSTLYFFNAYFAAANINLVYLRGVVRQAGQTYYFWNSSYA
jgi:hypothetical protein